MSDFIAPKPGEWDGEQRPLFLAPMSGVTDLPYRLLAKECGADCISIQYPLNYPHQRVRQYP